MADQLTRLEQEFLHRMTIYFGLRRRYRRRKTAKNALEAQAAQNKADEALIRLVQQEEKLGFRVDEREEVRGSQEGREPRDDQESV